MLLYTYTRELTNGRLSAPRPLEGTEQQLLCHRAGLQKVKTMMSRRCCCVALLHVLAALLSLVDVQCFSPAASSIISSGGCESRSTLSLQLVGTGTHHDNDNNNDNEEEEPTQESSTVTTKTRRRQRRRQPQQQRRRGFLMETVVMLSTTVQVLLQLAPSAADAAPPIAIIAEELGYFPVTNRNGDTVYVPKRVSRTSSQQSIDLAKHLQNVSTN